MDGPTSVIIIIIIVIIIVVEHALLASLCHIRMRVSLLWLPSEEITFRSINDQLAARVHVYAQPLERLLLLLHLLVRLGQTCQQRAHTYDIDLHTLCLRICCSNGAYSTWYWRVASSIASNSSSMPAPVYADTPTARRQL